MIGAAVEMPTGISTAAGDATAMTDAYLGQDYYGGPQVQTPSFGPSGHHLLGQIAITGLSGNRYPVDQT